MNFSKRTIFAQHPIARIAAPELDRLITTLDVTYLMLTECLVSSGNRLQLRDINMPGMHYNLSGNGRLVVEGMSPIELRPHTLVILPPRHPILLEAANSRGQFTSLAHVECKVQIQPGTQQRFVAGDPNNPEIILICGYFKASYGPSIDIFAQMNSPIVESFTAKDRLDQKLKDAVGELI